MSDTATPPAPITKANIEAGGAVAGLAPQNIEDAFRLSKALASAGDMVPKHFQGKPEMIMAAVLRGAEVGLAPMQALSNIAVINGRASMWGDALVAVVQRAGHTIDVEMSGEGDSLTATATLLRGDTGARIVRTFAMTDAKKAGLANKQGPWQQYPRRMLAARARSYAIRDGAADALMGLSVAEEMEDVRRMRNVTPSADPSPLQQRIEAQRAADAKAKDDQTAPSDDTAPIDGEIMPEGDDEAPADDAHWTVGIDTSDAFPGDDTFDEGVKAQQAGHKRTTCPYEAERALAAGWLHGWDQAKAQENVA